MSPAGFLFDADLPDGFDYREDFLAVEEEAALADSIARVAFSDFEMRGVIARRRVAFFGLSYDNRTPPAMPMPAFLFGLRERIAAWASLPANAFAMALINEYRPGAPIGWHRDAPQYDKVAGVSLLTSCRMRFRPYVSPRAHRASGARREATHELRLAPRSAYLMYGLARQAFEHSIPPVDALRYSITFRTLRDRDTTRHLGARGTQPA